MKKLRFGCGIWNVMLWMLCHASNATWTHVKLVVSCPTLPTPSLRVLQECRFVPRVREMFNELSRRRPHVDAEGNCIQIRCHCEECDVKIAASLPPRLSSFCDCDQYMRWICLKCRDEEEALDLLYLKNNTKSEDQYPGYPDEALQESNPGMWRFDSQNSLAVSNSTREALNPIT